MKLSVTRQAYRYLVHKHVLKLFIKQIHAYVGISDDDGSILILCRCFTNELRYLPMNVVDFMQS